MPFKSKYTPYKKKYAPKAKPTYSNNNKVSRFKRPMSSKGFLTKRIIPTGMPSSFTTHLTYHTNFNMSAAAGGTALNYQFNLNSIYDPDRTSTGHQALWHDTFRVIYENYRVIGCLVEVRFVSNNTPCDVVLFDTNETTTYTSMNLIQEQKRVRSKLVGITNPLRIRRYYPIYKVLEVPFRNYMTDDVYMAQNGNNPAQAAILNIYAKSLSSVSATDLDVEVKLTYTTKYTNVFDQSSS